MNKPPRLRQTTEHNMTMQNLGLFKGYPEQRLSNEEQDALFLANQRNHPLTRTPGDQFRPIQKTPTREPSEPKKPG